MEAKDDVPDIADEKLGKDLSLDNDGNAGEEEQPSIPRMQESDDLSSLGASNDGIEMAMSDDSDDSFTYMMRYCRCIESNSMRPTERAIRLQREWKGVFKARILTAMILWLLMVNLLLQIYPFMVAGQTRNVEEEEEHHRKKSVYMFNRPLRAWMFLTS